VPVFQQIAVALGSIASSNGYAGVGRRRTFLRGVAMLLNRMQAVFDLTTPPNS
jgi:hypothetical protein